MLRYKFYIFSILILVFLSGCGTVYKSPSSGPIAYLGAKKNHIVPDVIVIYGDMNGCRLPTVATMKDRMNATAFPIVANQLLSVGVTHFNGDHLSQAGVFNYAITFLPVENNTYFINVKNSDERDYIVSTLELWGISQQDKINNTYHLVPFIKRDYQVGEFTSGTCVDTGLQNELSSGKYNTVEKVTSWSQRQKFVIVPSMFVPYK